MRIGIAIAACIAATAHAGSYEARWQLPTTNVDGSTIAATGPGALVRTVVQWSICRDGAFGTRLGVSRYDMPATSGVIDGLEVDTAYCLRAAVENMGGERSEWSNVVQVTLGATPPPTEPPPIVVPTPNAPQLEAPAIERPEGITGSVRYIGTGGSDAADGLTHATRWATANKAKSLPTGTDVYLLAGTDLRGQWSINWSGTQSDRAVIGCYYMAAGVPTSCDGTSQARPILRGTYATSCRPEGFPINNPNQVSTCPAESKDAIPKGRFDGLLQSTGQQYVTIQDLQVIDSSGAGIVIDEEDRTPSYAIIQRNRINQTYGRAFNLLHAAENSRLVFRNNDVDLGSLAYVDGRAPKWSACVVLESDGKDTRVLFEGNSVTNCGGEGLSSLRSNYNVFRFNTISYMRRTSMYADNSSYGVYENNTIVGGGYGGQQFDGGASAMTVRVEPYNRNTFNAIGNVYRNNVMKLAKRAFTVQITEDSWANCNPCNNPAEMGFKAGLVAYGNTAELSEKHSDAHLVTGRLIYDDKTNVDQLRVQHNLFIGPAKCAVEKGLPAAAVTIGNNVYTRSTSNVCAAATDVTGAPFADYRTSTKMPAASGLVRLDATKYPQIADFTVCHLTAAEWSQPLAVDHECQRRTNYAGAYN